jgi:uncharacterized membrane protein YphA (DoxX/SURF4 family)
MRATFSATTASNLGVLIGRVQIGMYFVLEGGYKLHVGVDRYLQTNGRHVPRFVPAELGRGVLLALPWVQMTVGVMIILGLRTRWAAGVAACVLLSIAGLKSMLSDPLDVLFHHTLAFFGMAMLLALHGGGNWTIERIWRAPQLRRARSDQGATPEFHPATAA